LHTIKSKFVRIFFTYLKNQVQNSSYKRINKIELCDNYIIMRHIGIINKKTKNMSSFLYLLLCINE